MNNEAVFFFWPISYSSKKKPNKLWNMQTTECFTTLFPISVLLVLFATLSNTTNGEKKIIIVKPTIQVEAYQASIFDRDFMYKIESVKYPFKVEYFLLHIRRNIIKGSMWAQRRKTVIWELFQANAHSPLVLDRIDK